MVTDEKVAELKAKHGDCAVVRITCGNGTKETFVFKHPTRGQYKMWRAAARKEDPDAPERLAIGMCVSHSHEEFEAFLDVPGQAPAADRIILVLDEWIAGKAEQQGKD